MALTGVPPRTHSGKGQLPAAAGMRTDEEFQAQKLAYEGSLAKLSNDAQTAQEQLQAHIDFIDQFESILVQDSDGIQEACEALELDVKKNTADRTKLLEAFSVMKTKMLGTE